MRDMKALSPLLLLLLVCESVRAFFGGGGDRRSSSWVTSGCCCTGFRAAGLHDEGAQMSMKSRAKSGLVSGTEGMGAVRICPRRLVTTPRFGEEDARI